MDGGMGGGIGGGRKGGGQGIARAVPLVHALMPRPDRQTVW